MELPVEIKSFRMRRETMHVGINVMNVMNQFDIKTVDVTFKYTAK